MKWVCLFGALLSTLGACSGGTSAYNATTSPAAGAIVLQGVPPDSVSVASPYVFTPALARGRTPGLRFAVEGLPAWAQFDASTGTLSGTPTVSAVGLSSGIRILAQDDGETGSLGPFAIRVDPPAAGGPVTTPHVAGSLSIAGIPAHQVLANQRYRFMPTAVDADGASLTFTIENAPGWATFNSATGELSGTPTSADVGTFSNVGLSVSDGAHTASLAQFSIIVTETAPGSASLTWIPPTDNTDGTALTNLAGYRIHYGNDAGQLTHTISIDNAATTDYVVGNLTPGTWYFAITAVSNSHVESAESAVRTTAVL